MPETTILIRHRNGASYDGTAARNTERRRDYRRRLQEELERVFGVRVSGETLRPLLRELRGGGGARAGSAGEEAAGSAERERGADRDEEGSGPVGAGRGSRRCERVGHGRVYSGAARDGKVGGTRIGWRSERGGGGGPAAWRATVAAAPSGGGESVEVPGVCPAERALVLPVTSKRVPPTQDGSASAPAPALGAGEQADPLALPRFSLASRSSPPPPANLTPRPASGEGGLVVVPAACAPEGLALPASGKVFPTAPDWPVGQTVWSEHAGLLLFGEALAAVSQVVEPAQPWLRQALGSVLAGALNVEQTKFLNPDDLELLLGPQLRGLGPQRRRLKELAEGPTANRLLRWNSQQLGAEAQRDFYLDPHTKQYTGMAEVLKGWCPTIHWADKALHSDFLHTVSGQPIYFECSDNYEDSAAAALGTVGPGAGGTGLVCGQSDHRHH